MCCALFRVIRNFIDLGRESTSIDMVGTCIKIVFQFFFQFRSGMVSYLEVSYVKLL